MRRLIILTTVVSVLVSGGMLMFFQGNALLKKILVVQIEREILLSRSFWDKVDIRWYWSGPAFLGLKSVELQTKAVSPGATLYDDEYSRYFIQLNAYYFIHLGDYVTLRSKYSYKERFAELKEILAHEIGHVIHRTVAYELREKFQKELGKKFEDICIITHNTQRCFANSWENSHNEAFADIARMILCPSCNQEPETAMTVTPTLKKLAKEIIDVALK